MACRRVGESDIIVMDLELMTQRFNSWGRVRIAWGHTATSISAEVSQIPSSQIHIYSSPKGRVTTRSQTHHETRTKASNSQKAFSSGPQSLNPLQLVYYTSREQSIYARKKREETRGWRPTALVRKTSRESSPALTPLYKR